MNPDFTVVAVSGRSAPPVKMLLFAIAAPFAAIALMATPLVLDAVRHRLGL
jgi:hypothetical protein